MMLKGVDMRTALTLASVACVSSSASWASADYYLQIKGVASEGAYTYLDVSSTGDLDGDGSPDDAIVRLQCVGAELRSADYVVRPRDAAAGQASGKRMHKPVTFVKDWSAPTPQLTQMRPGYNIKELKGARTATEWTTINLADAPTLCGDVSAAVKITKSRSNIQNN